MDNGSRKMTRHRFCERCFQNTEPDLAFGLEGCTNFERSSMRDQRQKRRSNESLEATAAAYSLALLMLIRAVHAASGEELLLYKAPNTENLSQAAISDIGAEQPGISPPFVVQE